MEGNAGIENRENQFLNRDFIRRVEDRFNTAFVETLGDEKPIVHVEPFFSYHEVPEDLEGLKDKIRDSDMYIPEIFGWTANQLQLLRSSSAGEISLEEIIPKLSIYSPVFRKNIEDLYNSKKAIAIIDVPARHRLTRKSRSIWTYNPSYAGNFSQVLDYTRFVLDNLAEYHYQRENYILEQITPQKIEELLNTYPYLRSMESIRILISFGLGHSLMPLGFPESSFTDQGITARRINRKVNDDLAAKIFLESFFNTAIYTGPIFSRMDSRKVALFKRRLIGYLNIEDANRIFNYRKRMGIEMSPRDEFNRIYNEKGIRLPENEREIDKFLASPNPTQDKANDTYH